MAKTNWRRIGLVATILFVPGGFVFGASMLARQRQKRAEEAAADAPREDASEAPPKV